MRWYKDIVPVLQVEQLRLGKVKGLAQLACKKAVNCQKLVSSTLIQYSFDLPLYARLKGTKNVSQDPQ